MQIETRKVVTLNYTLTDNTGKVLDESQDGSFAYLHGANNIIPGLENALTGRKTGDQVSVSVEPQEAYGERDDSKMVDVPKTAFPNVDRIAPGMQFQAKSPGGDSLMVTVVKVQEETVTIDGNHPLAGVQLNFAVEVVDVRDATSEEIDHGHVHGPGGHHHQ